MRVEDVAGTAEAHRPGHVSVAALEVEIAGTPVDIGSWRVAEDWAEQVAEEVAEGCSTFEEEKSKDCVVVVGIGVVEAVQSVFAEVDSSRSHRKEGKSCCYRIGTASLLHVRARATSPPCC